MQIVTPHDADVFTVSELLTADECADFIRRGETLGFEAASVRTHGGPQMLPGIRNNDRANFEDADLAARLWERARPFAPPEMDGFAAVGLDSHFRFYRYDQGQRFKRHQDGRARLPTGEVSRITLLIYLNDGYQGGQTIFSDYENVSGGSILKKMAIEPETGTGLFFVHERKHEGAAILEGRKYVLRTDILYAGGQLDRVLAEVK